MKLNYPHVSIQCGLKYSIGESSNKTEEFWPVAEAFALPIVLDKQSFDSEFSFVFSSKTAVQFFYEKIYALNKDIFKSCVSIYCVGHKTREYFQSLFSNENIDTSIFCAKQTGMQNLFDEFHLNQLKEKIIFVTIHDGKSREVIANHHFINQHIVIPIYDLRPYKTNFLNNLFNLSENTDTGALKFEKNYSFECYSGRIFNYAASFLMEFFKCDHITDLPQNIQMSAIGASAREQERKLYEK